MNIKGKILITSMDPHLELEIGDKILIKGLFTHQSEVVPSDEFDYGEYLKIQRIDYTVFVKDISDIVLMEKYDINIKTIFNPLRKQLYKEFRDNLRQI